MSENLTEQTISEFREAFETFDLDKDGYLSLKDIADLVKALGYQIKDDEIADIVGEIDIDGNGTVDFKEFIQLMARKMRDVDNEEEMIEAFKLFDRNHDDLISIEDMKEIMVVLSTKVYGERITDDEVVQMIKEADDDGDGFINYREFVKKIQNIQD